MAFSLRRVIQRITGIGRPKEPPPERPSPPPPPPPSGAPPVDRTARYRQIWNRTASPGVIREVSGRTGYSREEQEQAHLEIFLAMPGMMEEEARERYRLWGQYVRVMVNGNVSKREREEFFEELYLDERDFDWQLWREIMGYSRNAA